MLFIIVKCNVLVNHHSENELIDARCYTGYREYKINGRKYNIIHLIGMVLGRDTEKC